VTALPPDTSTSAFGVDTATYSIGVLALGGILHDDELMRRGQADACPRFVFDFAERP
jgi:hypothetical protein